MANLHPDEIYRARYFAEIQRARKLLDRFADGKMRLFEAPADSEDLTDITEDYVAEMKAHIEELEFFLDVVKAPLKR